MAGEPDEAPATPAGRPDRGDDAVDAGAMLQTIGPARRRPLPSTVRFVQTIIERAMTPADGALLAAGGGRSLRGLVDDLEVQETLARGGSGIIRVANQPSLARRVVVKTLQPERRTRRDVEALFREAAVSGRLDHPNVVPVHALGLTATEGPFLVMKHVEGTTWAHRLAARAAGDGPPRLHRELDVLRDVCRAVAFAHDRGIVHRDIKPANVMLGRFGEVYLLDWGAALDFRDEDVEQRREVVGTPAYMAPELADPTAEATPLTDVYLLGATLCHVLTGSPPHLAAAAGGGGLEAVLQAARTSAPVTLGPDVPAALAAVVHRACAPSPGDRFPSVEALLAAIEDFLEHEGSLATLRRAEDEQAELERLMTSWQAEGGTTASGDRASIDARIQRRFSVCRFAFEAALEQWPGNDPAARGLRGLLARMAEYELDRDNPTAAAAHLAELDGAPTRLVERLESAREQARRRAEAAATVSAMREDQRFHGLDWMRSIVAAVSGVLATLAGWALGAWRRSGGDLGPAELAGVLAAFTVLSALSGVVFRHSLADSGTYRRFLNATTATCAAGTMMCLVAWWAGIALDDLWLGMCYLGVGAALTMALSLEPVMWLVAALAIVAAPITVSHPAYAPDVIGLGFGLTGLLLAWVVRPGRREPTG